MKQSKENLRIYNAIDYLRLSVEDGDKKESDSITNQRALILNYVKNHKDIRIVAEKADDGYTGTNFERPGFQEMLEMLKNGEADCIIVKDLSRFSRDFSESLRYIQRRFPKWGVRFIAINDDYDSESERCKSDYVTLPIKSLINDQYPADTSNKIRNNLKVKRENGHFTGAFASYGYLKAPDNNDKLIVDEYAAEIVKDIYRWKIEGFSQEKIAAKLNQQGELPPMEYKRSIGINYRTSFRKNRKSGWTAVAVGRILHNSIYLGVLEQGKTTTPNHKVKKIIFKPKEDWDIVENTHESIISYEDFTLVHGLLGTDTRTAPGEERLYLFSGILECSDCHEKMIRKTTGRDTKYVYYICSTNKNIKKCSSHSISEKKLEHAVLKTIQYHISNLADIKSLLHKTSSIPSADFKISKSDKKLDKLQKEHDKVMKLIASLYEDYSEEILTKEEYLQYKKNYSERCEEIEALIAKQKEESETSIENIRKNNTWIDRFLSYENITELTRCIIVNLVNKIIVYQSGNIEIVFKFCDEYSKLIHIMERIDFLSSDNVTTGLLQKEEGGVMFG